MDKGLDESGLNESQTGAVLACLGMLQHRAKSAVELIWGPPGTGKTKTIVTLLLILLRMNCRALICAPTNVAITEVASHILKMVTETESSALFCSLGKILLFGNKERLKLKKRLKLKVGSDIEEIYLDHRIQRLVECTGWVHCFASMINLLEDCVRDYNIFLGNELTKEKEQNSVCEMKDECRSGPEASKDKCKTFLEYFRDRFVRTALPLRHCISVFCTHMTNRCISKHIFEDMVSLICLVDSFEELLFQSNVMSEAMENLFSCSEVEDVSESYVDDSIPLFLKRRECLVALRTLQYSLRKLQLPDFRNENALMELCFQSASLIFCTASSSFKLHRMEMEPFSIVVIDEAAQMKECESTIPLQLPGVKHVALFGDECQLPAMVQSNVS
jgi:senataxin